MRYNTKVFIMYMDQALQLNMFSVTPSDAASRVFVNGRFVTGPVVATPEEYLARLGKGLLSRRGLLLGTWKRLNAKCPTWERRGVDTVHSLLRKAGWYEMYDELSGETHVFYADESEEVDKSVWTTVLLRGIGKGDTALRERLGCGWGTLMGTDRAKDLLSGFITRFHNEAYGL